MEYTPWVLVSEMKKVYIGFVIIGESSLLFGLWLILRLSFSLLVCVVCIVIHAEFANEHVVFPLASITSSEAFLGSVLSLKMIDIFHK